MGNGREMSDALQNYLHHQDHVTIQLNEMFFANDAPPHQTFWVQAQQSLSVDIIHVLYQFTNLLEVSDNLSAHNNILQTFSSHWVYIRREHRLLSGSQKSSSRKTGNTPLNSMVLENMAMTRIASFALVNGEM